MNVFRRIIGSRIGAAIGVAFLAIIFFAFAAGDITGTGGLQTLAGGSGDRIAKVGDETITTAEVQTLVQRAFEQQRRQDPSLTIESFISQGAVEEIYRQMVERAAVRSFANDQGIAVSKRMIDAEIAKIGAFQDASGKFDEATFRAAIGRQGINEADLRRDIESDLLSKQILVPASLGVKLPDSLVLPYASLLLETREGSIAAIPSAAFIGKDNPSEKDLAAYYKANASRFTVPELRVLRYAVIDVARFKSAAVPTDAEIAAYYDAHKADYAAKQQRSIEQLVLPTQAAAKSVADAVKGGKSLKEAAANAGLAVATFSDLTKDELRAQTNSEVANTAFATKQGELAAPVKTALGWTLVRVTGVGEIPGKTIQEARSTISHSLEEQKSQQLLSDFTGKLDDEIANGSTFEEVTKDNGLAVQNTPPVLSNGAAPGKEDYKPNDEVRPLLGPAFGMEADDDPQIVPLVPQQRYALLKLGPITPAAPPPLDKVHDAIVVEYKLSKGAEKAKAVADAIRAKVAKGMKLEQAMAQAGVKLPPIQKAGGRRADVMRGDKQVPPELALMFRMAPGTVKPVEIPGNRGYFLVQLDKIIQQDAAKVPGLTDRVRVQLNDVAGQEYAQQFNKSLETYLKASTTDGALDKVKQALRAANGTSQ